MRIPFSPPNIDHDVHNEVLATLDSGWITSDPWLLTISLFLVALNELAWLNKFDF